MSRKPSVSQLNAVLPQTQCGLCDYAGCKPYAQAMHDGSADINRCPPGGIDTLIDLAQLFHKDPTPYLEQTKATAKPPSLAVIRENDCIGCTKCIQACPTDAIVGSAKMMHTVIADACTGCELCLPPCPVDCIDLITLPERTYPQKTALATQWRNRYQKKTKRLAKEQEDKEKRHLAAKSELTHTLSVETRKTAIEQALLRARAKKRGR